MSPNTARKIHLALLAAWLFIGVPVSLMWRESIAWVVFLSVYAVVVGHASAWSAERPSEVTEG